MFILDSHCDTPSQMLRGRDVGISNPGVHVDFPKLKAGGVDASFFALYTPAEMEGDAATVHALKMLGKVYDALDAAPDQAALALTPGEALANKEKGLVSIFIGMENGSPITLEWKSGLDLQTSSPAIINARPTQLANSKGRILDRLLLPISKMLISLNE
jgi:microsomal dipeptidase-like Zn-dependent dipeptidase